MKSEDGDLQINAVGKPEAAFITARELKNADGSTGDFMIEFINDSALDLFNKTKNDLLYQPFSLVFSPYCNPDILKVMSEVYKSGITQGIQSECINMGLSKDGKNLYHITISRAGEELNLIFERLETEADDDYLREINLTTKLIFENIPIGAYLTTSDGRILMANGALISMLGYESFSELAKRNLEKEGYENISHTRTEFKKTIEEKGKIRGFESVWMKKDGDVIYVRENASVIAERGGIKYYEGTVEDISHEKRAEIKLVNSESLVTSIIDSLSCHLAVIDSSGEIIKVNQAWEKFASENNAVTNVSVGANYLKACENSDLHEAKAALDGILKVLRGETSEFLMEYSCHSPETRRWFMMAVKPLHERKGASICHTNISENILFLEKLENALSELGRSQQQLKDAQKMTHVGSYSFNLISKKAEWSEELYNIFERDKDIAAPDDEEFLKYLHPDDQIKLRQTGIDSIEKKETNYRIELRALFDEGKRVKYIETHGRIFYDKNGIPVKYFGTMADITERKNSELRLKKIMNQLKISNEELEQFAYIASHDLQEPLRMISSYIYIIEKNYAGQLDTEAGKYFDFVREGAERMKQLINDLLQYSRVSSGPKNLKSVDLNSVIRDVISDCSIIIENARAKIEVSELPYITADEVQMRQLFQNLISNAIKFRGIEDPVVSIFAVKKKASWIISVQDNGIGIEEKDRERVFKIFQRLHDRSQYPGTGIGLSVCRKIVERHNGRIWIESEPGKGTVFHFTIPVR